VGVKLGLSCPGYIIGQGFSRMKYLERYLCQRGTSGRLGNTASLFFAKDNWDDHIRDDKMDGTCTVQHELLESGDVNRQK